MQGRKEGIDPLDLEIRGNAIAYNPKKKPARSTGVAKPKRSKLVKPDGMTPDEFYNKICLPNSSPKEQQEAAKYGSEEEWRELPNKGRFFRGKLDPSKCIEVSNMGRILVIDCSDGLKSGINKGVYFEKGRQGCMVHINTFDEETGKKLQTTGLLANMVIDAFFDSDGELDYNKYKVRYIDGDPMNCALNNLDYVEIDRNRKGSSDPNNVEDPNEQLAESIMKRIRGLVNEGANNDPNNTHWAVDKTTHKIYFAWDYSGYDPAELRQFKNDYFIVDMDDMEFPRGIYTILGKRGLAKYGIDPNDDSNWANHPGLN